MKFKLLQILCAIGVGTIPILILVWINSLSLYKANGFSRNLLKNEPSRLNVYPLPYKGYYYSGKDSASVYFGHQKAPAHVLKFNYQTKRLTLLSFELVIENKDEGWESMVSMYREPYFYFINGPSNSYYRALQFDTCPIYGQKIRDGKYNKSHVIDTNSIIIREYDGLKHRTYLTKLIFNSKETGKFKLSDEKAGILSQDGTFLEKGEGFVYLYYYKNSSLIFENGLEPKILTTIDTTTIPKISVQYLNDSTQLTWAKQPLLVNRLGAVYQNLLLICSGLKADNETMHDFKNNSVLDVYDLNDNKYLASFYIPMHKGKKLNAFSIINEHEILALYEQSIIIYQSQWLPNDLNYSKKSLK